MTNKDLSAYSKIIFICFIICLFKRGKKMQANCTLSLAEAFHIHYFLFTYLVVNNFQLSSFSVGIVISVNKKYCQNISAYYRCFFIEVFWQHFTSSARKLFRNSKHKGVLQFIYYEKATKFCEIFTLLLTVWTVIKSIPPLSSPKFGSCL